MIAQVQHKGNAELRRTNFLKLPEIQNSTNHKNREKAVKNIEHIETKFYFIEKTETCQTV